MIAHGLGEARLRRGRDWLRRNFFSTWYYGVLSLASAAGATWAAAALLRWAVLDAAFGTTRASCRAAAGACWSIVGEMWPIFMVGLYTYEERWRPAAAGLLLLLLAAVTVLLRVGGRRWLLGAWVLGLAGVFVLIRGSGALGLELVQTQKWGGLMLTLILAGVGQTLAFPVGILLALGRRSRSLPFVRVVCVLYIELMRSVPLITVLLMASYILPLFLPSGMVLDKLLAAQIGIIMFSAATLAEVVRGGLQAIPREQEEAAFAIGLGSVHTVALVVLPQALRVVLPALVSTFIMFVKGSSLVVIVGLYDLLGAALLASTNENWVGITIEPLLFSGAIFWLICYSLSLYSRRLERRYRLE
jgi:general L-amino acid transport system permease protein